MEAESMQQQPIIFCDFDGTITDEETAVTMMNQFAPEMAAKIIPEIFNQTISLKDGVPLIWESIPSSRYQEMIAVSGTKKIRPGFVELLDFLDDRNIPLVVISGGLRFMLETILGKLLDRVEAIYALDVDPSGEYLQISSQVIGKVELLDKVKVMQQYDPELAIAIGDSVTDFNLALSSDLVFARSRLAKYLEARQKSFISWENFFDIRDYLATYLI